MFLGVSDLALGAAADRRRVYRRVAWLNPHIDHRHTARFDAVDRGPQNAWQLVGAADRAESLAALGLRQHPEIGLGIGDALADPAVGDRPVALPRHAVLVQFVVEER